MQEFQNSGQSRIVNLLSTKVKQLRITFKNKVRDQLLADGTGNGGKDITGLLAAVEDGTAWGTYGNIDSNTWTFWRNQFLDFDASFGTTFATLASGQAEVDGVRALRRLTHDCTRGTDRPNLILTSQTIAEAYQNVASGDGKGRLSLNANTFDLGFSSYTFEGIPIVWDDGVAADDMFFLNTDYLHLVMGKGRKFKLSEFMEPADQDARVAKMLLYAQLTVSNRSLQGRIIDLTV
jgi:hypothetical protein